MKKLIMILSLIFLPIVLSSCSIFDKGDYQMKDLRLFKNTPAWELALAVKNQKTKEIEKISKKDPELLNYQEPKFGETLLLWAVGNEKYNSAETLLKCGADPNIASTYEGETPLFLAADFSWIDREAKKDPKYVKLLLSYGANPNQNYEGTRSTKIRSIPKGTSPLMNSIGRCIEKTKALVEAGADINNKSKFGVTAAVQALRDDNVPEYAYYLIVEKKAKVSEPYNNEFGSDDYDEKFYPVDRLRDWTCDLDSEEYKMKMEIVEEFKRQGVDYWSTKIPDKQLEYIKKLYPDTWEEYIKRY